MSVSILLNPEKSQWKRFAMNTLNCNDIDTQNIDTNTINNLPIPSGGIDPNPANIIYRPGSVNPTDSNVVSTWAEVVAKADNINVNECLNVYIDNSIVDPALIDQSLDCKGRVRLLSHTYSAAAFTNVRIIDGVVLTNPREIQGTIGIECESLTSPNIVLNNGSILVCREGGFLTNTSSSLVPSLEIADSNFNVLSVALGGRMGTSAVGVALVNVGIGSTLVFNNLLDTTGQTYIANSISSTDATGNIFLILDASVDKTLFINSGFTGTVLNQTIDQSINIGYNDATQAPASGSSTVQGSIDWLKTQIGVGSAPSDIIYRPSGVTADNVFSLWSEVLTASSAVNNLVNIYFDDSLVAPLPCSINISHDFEGHATFNTLNNNPINNTIAQIENGIQIKNLKGVYGLMTLRSDNQNGNPSIVWDNGVESLELYGCTLDSTAGSTGAYIDVPTFLRVQMFNNSTITSTGSLAISVQPSGLLYISSEFGSILQGNVISGDPSTTLFITGDASQNSASQVTSFLGTIIPNNLDKSDHVEYNDALQLPKFGTTLIPVDTVQKGFDNVKKQINSITYRQGAPTSTVGSVYATWAEILQVCNANTGEIMIYFDNGMLGYCEIDASYDFGGRVSFHSINNSDLTTNIRVLDGVLLTNLKSLNGTVLLDCRNTSGGQSLAFTNSNNFFINDWATCTNANGSGVALNVPDGISFQIQLANLCAIITNPAHPFINVGIGSTLGISLFNASSVQTNAIKSTDATATLNPYYDAGSYINTHAGFTGSISLQPMVDYAGNVSYTDTIPLLGSDNVEGAINALKNSISPLSSTRSRVVYKQNALSSGNIYGTWAEIVAVLTDNDNSVDLYFDEGTLGYCEISSSYNFQGKTDFYANDNGGSDYSYARILDGVLLENVRSINGTLEIDVYNPSGNTAMTFDNGATFYVNDFASIFQVSGASAPIKINDGFDLFIQQSNNTNLYSNATELIKIGVSSRLFHYMFNLSYLDNNAIASTDGSAQWFPWVDASSTSNTSTQAGFTGSILSNNMDKAVQVKYDDSLVLPALSTTTTQGAIDKLKAVQPDQLVSFRAIVGTGLTNVTGDSTPYDVVFATQNFDPFNIYDNTTGTMTAPMNGFYHFTANVLINNLSVGHTTASFRLVKNTNVYLDESFCNPYVVAVGGVSTNLRVSTMAYLNQNDTVVCQLTVTGSTLTVGIAGTTPNLAYSSFCCKQLS